MVEHDKVKLEQGMVQVPLPGTVDLESLTKDLKGKGYHLANEPEETDSQGWGKRHDASGYYPYWVYRSGKEWYFAFPPEDYANEGKDGHEAVLGPKATEEIDRWLPYLKKWLH